MPVFSQKILGFKAIYAFAKLLPKLFSLNEGLLDLFYMCLIS